MAAKAKTPKTVAEATAAFEAILASPPYIHDGSSTTFVWQRPQWKKYHELVAAAPPGLAPELLDRLLAIMWSISWVTEVAEMPAHFDDAIVRFLESSETADVNAVFVMTALATGRGERHPRLRELCARAGHGMPWAAHANRAALETLVATRPEVVEGARAAVAFERGLHPTSTYLPIVVADGTPASLDIILPHLEAARVERGGTLDWIRKELVPLFADNSHTRALIASLVEATDERTQASPARAFLEELGGKAPPVVKLTCSFRDAAGKTTYQIKLDSTVSGWFCGRRNPKWQWQSRGMAPATLGTLIPVETTDYVLRVGAGIDRAAVDRWIRDVISEARRC